MRSWPLIVVLLLFAAAASAQEAVSTVIVPVVGSVFGPGVRWKTDVEVINDTGRAADVALELSAAPGAPFIAFTLAPGDTQRFTDIIGQAFGIDLALSPMRVMTSGRRSVTVRATVYGLRGEGLSPLQPVAVYPEQSFYPLRVLDGLAFSDDFRTNIGLVNFSDGDADFALALQRVPGRNIAITRVRVGPGSFLHTSIQSLVPLITKGTDFSVVVESGAPETYIYASVVESATQAGTFVAPRIGNR